MKNKSAFIFYILPMLLFSIPAVRGEDFVNMTVLGTTLNAWLDAMPALQTQNSNATISVSNALATASNALSVSVASAVGTLAAVDGLVNVASESRAGALDGFDSITPEEFGGKIEALNAAVSNAAMAVNISSNAIANLNHLASGDFNPSISNINAAVAVVSNANAFIYGSYMTAPIARLSQYGIWFANQGGTYTNFTPITVFNITGYGRMRLTLSFTALANTTVSIRAHGETNEVAANSMNCVYIPQGQMAEMSCNTDSNRTFDVKSTGAVSIRFHTIRRMGWDY